MFSTEQDICSGFLEPVHDHLQCVGKQDIVTVNLTVELLRLLRIVVLVFLHYLSVNNMIFSLSSLYALTASLSKLTL